MKLCAGHMHDLAHDIKHKGMWHLVRPESSVHFAQRWLAGKALREEFDPLVVAHLEINAKAQQLFPQHCSNGSCPLCAACLILQNADAADSWIDNISDLVLIVAKTNNLMTKGA